MGRCAGASPISAPSQRSSHVSADARVRVACALDDTYTMQNIRTVLACKGVKRDRPGQVKARQVRECSGEGGAREGLERGCGFGWADESVRWMGWGRLGGVEGVGVHLWQAHLWRGAGVYPV